VGVAGTIGLCSGGVAACGGSGGGYSDPVAAVRAVQTAFKQHDADTACGAITDSLKNAMVPGKVGVYSWKTCDDLAHVAFTHNAGVLIKEATIGKANVNGSTASVPIRMKLNIGDSPQPATVKLVREGGGWRIGDLCALGACFKQAFIIRRKRGSS
jgi:hypothetical protein